MLWRGVEAASDDMACAASFVAEHASRWNVDPQRIALWGWSAGGRTALNAAFAERFPAAAVVACSGYMALADLERTVTSAETAPAVLIATAERDLPHIRAQAPVMAEFLGPRVARFASLTVVDTDHFYPATAAVRDAGVWQRASLLQSMTAFLEDILQPG
jgi:dienelactone hydrolase